MRKVFTKHIVFLIGLFSLIAVQLSASSSLGRVYVKGVGFCQYSNEQSHLHVSATSTKVERQFLAEEVETEIEEEDYSSKKQVSTQAAYEAAIFYVGLTHLSSTQNQYLQHQQQAIYEVTPRYLANCVFRI